MSEALLNFTLSLPERRRTLFRPHPPATFEEAGLYPAQVESLVLKFLLSHGSASGRRIAVELGLPFRLFPEFLRRLKDRQNVSSTEAATANDALYALTDVGRARAQLYFNECSYVGTAPVPFDTYVDSVAAQSITFEHPKKEDLRRAFADLLISEEMFEVLGPAINSGRGLFLYGYPGNGKTSIAERITRCFGSNIWIPKVIEASGQLIKLFDLSAHEPVESQSASLFPHDDFDHRWIEIKRPTLIAGGELRMDDLELHFDPITKVSEAPLQLKSNNGTLLIDDFGRQRIAPIELLNRWTIPLEKRYDFLSLFNGKQIRVPFDQLILFSTNLEPRQLVDEGFMRRIPYKIFAQDPDEATFRALFRLFAPKIGFATVDEAAIDHLILRHYRRAERPFRSCQPRDLLLQIRNYCVYNNLPLEMKPQYFDFAANHYFTAM